MKEDTIMENMVVGLDIGTTKTCAVIGFLNENKQIEVVGVGVAPSKGLKSGVIVNIDNTVASIIKAIDDAELMGGCEVNSVFVGITGQHIKGENSRGVVAVANRNRTITPVEMKRVIEAAQAIVIPWTGKLSMCCRKSFLLMTKQVLKIP
jgi:cell division protein FtsA